MTRRKSEKPTVLLNVPPDLVETAMQLMDTPESPPAEMTVVPAQFGQMPDAVLAVAMARYHAVLDSGRAEEYAVTEGVIAAKLYARTQGIPYRR